MCTIYTALCSLIGILTFAALSLGEPKCVPKQKNFYYETSCPGYINLIQVNRIRMTQGNPPRSTDQLGGLDLTKPCTLHYNITDKYPKPIKPHLMDMKLYQYIPNDDGQCVWDEIASDAGLLDDMDVCPMLKNKVPCTYEPSQNYVVYLFDFKATFGDAVDGLKPNTYYKFLMHEKDGKKVINCMMLQSKVTKT